MSEKFRRAVIVAVPLIAIAVVAIGAYLAWLPFAPREEGPPKLLFLCGAGLRPPAEEAIELFQRRYGVMVEADYAGSNMLLGRLKVSRQGDVFLPGDAFYVTEAEKEGLVADSADVAWFVPAIMVPKGNPRRIAGVADLAKPGIRLGVADERAAALGRITPDIFRANGVAPEDVERNTAVTHVTVPELAQAVALGHVDAAIVWRPVAMQYPDSADIVDIPRENNVLSPVAAAVLTTASLPEEARQFVEFLAGPMGQEAFRKFHYEPASEVDAP